MLLGKKLQSVLIAVFLLVSVSAGAQAGKVFKYHFDGTLRGSDVITEGQSFTINYSLSELNVETIISEHGNFYRITIPGHTPSSVPGKPELPVSARLITIPNGFDYSIKISEVIAKTIEPSGENIEGILFPAQEGETKRNQPRKPEFAMDRSAYATKGIIPSDTVSIQPLGTLRNNRLANLYISPVRYNPHSNLLEVITSMKIEITFTSYSNYGSKSQLPESALFSDPLGKSVLNYNKDEVIPGYSDQPVRMIIVTDTAFKKHLEPFIKWKTQKGFKIIVLYKGTNFAGDTYTQIKDTISSIYRASTETDPPPEYLLIIGDVTRIPYYGTGNVTDMYYGEFDGDGDYIPEMYIGRLPVADTAELRVVLNKIIQYEKFEYADINDFYSKAIVTAGNDIDYRNTMNGQVKYATDNYLNISNNITGSHFYYPQSATADDSIKKLIDNGVSFINYTGHGDITGWLDPVIKIDSLKNKDMYPFVISNACQTSHFSSSNSMGNRMVVAAGKGAIGFIGCSNDSYWDEDFYWSVGHGTISDDPKYEETGLGAYDRLFHTNGESPSDWYFSMGQVNYAGNLAVSASTTARKKYYWETYNLVGDPSVIPILGKPRYFDIELPDTLPNGIKSFFLNAEPFAYVAISHFDTLWDAAFVNSSGTVTLELPGLSDDSCLIVITGQNKLPVIKTIYFSEITGEYIHLTATSLNDSLANNNGLADYGESLFLRLTVSNLGLTNATDLYAKISSESEWVTIEKDSVMIGSLAAGTDIILTNDLGISISENTPDMEIVTIQLKLINLNIEKLYSIDIFVHSPDLQIVNCIMDDSMLGNGDFIADPGESFSLIFKISNSGSSNTEGDFAVASSDASLTILSSDIKSGILKYGEVSEIPVMVKLSETVSSGSYISVSSILSCPPQIVDKNFTFRIGKIRESFEAESFSVFPWINLSPDPWIITSENSYDGSVAARSGSISHNSSTSLIIRTLFSADDSIKFFYKVSSETSYDFLSFKLNDTEILKKSGEIPWTMKAVAVTEGLNKLEWIYEKDQSVSSFADCAWIDMIDFAGANSVTYITRDIQVAKLVSPVQKDNIDKEPVTVKVLNVGRDTIKGFTLAYSVNKKTPYVQDFPDTILPYGDSISVTFTLNADFSIYGDYDFKVYGVDNEDDYLKNDTIKTFLQNTDLNDTLGVDDQLSSLISTKAYPNPFSEDLNILVDCKAEGILRLSFISSSGKKIKDFIHPVYPGENLIILNELRLISSAYYLRLELNGTVKTIPVIKVGQK